MLPQDPQLIYPDVIETYQQGLSSANPEEVLATIEEGGYIREPAGSTLKHQGKSEIRQFLGVLFEVGEVRLRHCSITDDGVCCAIEFYVDTWGDMALTPQAGIAVYERGVSGLLVAARIYDDVAVEEGAGG